MTTSDNIPVICLIGHHNSGKTTLGAQIVQHLKKAGLTVGIIKSTKDKGISFDQPGTDTHTYTVSGADQVALIAPDQIVLQAKRPDMDLKTLARNLFFDVDIIMAEGFKNTPSVPKIEVNRSNEQFLYPQLDNVIALVCNTPTGDLAHFTTEQSEEIAKFIIDTIL